MAPLELPWSRCLNFFSAMPELCEVSKRLGVVHLLSLHDGARKGNNVNQNAQLKPELAAAHMTVCFP
jgi:hypothetical protein